MPRFRWARPAAATYVVLLTLLMGLNLVRIGPGPNPGDAAWLGISGLMLAWLLELAGLPWPRVVLAGLTAATVGYLIELLDNGIAPLFLFLLVIWASYTGNKRDSQVALGLSLATLVPFWAQLAISVPWTVGLVSVWGAQYGDESDYIWTFVQRIRRKLEPDRSAPRYLLTETGVGYRMPAPDIEPTD